MLLVNDTIQKKAGCRQKLMKQRLRYFKRDVDWFRYVALMLIIANMTAISFSLAYIEQALNHIILTYGVHAGSISADTVLVL
jgi:hypothetical protein